MFERYGMYTHENQKIHIKTFDLEYYARVTLWSDGALFYFSFIHRCNCRFV